jgi:serine/threonine protein phosphatase PrpC
MGAVPHAARLIRDAPPAARALRAAAVSDPGSQREVNEDRVYADPSRGIFIVVDGVGGQAAGGRAADIALTTIKARLERDAGSLVDRVKDAITVANNDVFRAAAVRPEWRGMACVLTIVVVDGDRAIVGHVGDTRLYKLTRAGLAKITRDHSPVGEREDARQISELDAMQHPRRNEVYRDVGSDLHDPWDPDFIDIYEVPFEADAALLLCSDGLTDAIASTAIRAAVSKLAGDPARVVQSLVNAANAAGGKDNITVVYVEGEQFAGIRQSERPLRWRWAIRIAVVGVLAVAAAVGAERLRPEWRTSLQRRLASAVATRAAIVVEAGASIADALGRAPAGATIFVEPGEYHDRLKLRDGVRLVSRQPRGAVIRLPGGASEADPAVVAAGIQDAEFAGFRIIGDAASPLGTGVLVSDSNVSIVDVEISGAKAAAIEIAGRSTPSVVGTDIRDNPGAALIIRAGASPRLVHNVFIRNGLSTAASEILLLEAGAEPRFSGNVFRGLSRSAFESVPDPARSGIVRDNWFLDAEPGRPASSRPPRAAAGHP